MLSDKGTNLECDWKFDQLCACCSKVYCGSPRTDLESRRVGSAGDSSHDGVNANAGAHALRLQGHSFERMVRWSQFRQKLANCLCCHSASCAGSWQCAVAQVTSQPLSGVRLSGESGTGSRFTSDCTAFVTVHGFCGSSVIHMIQLVSFSEVFHLLSHVKSGHYQIAFSSFARTDRSRGSSAVDKEPSLICGSMYSSCSSIHANALDRWVYAETDSFELCSIAYWTRSTNGLTRCVITSWKYQVNES